VDLGYKGTAFTWTNKPHSSTMMYVRLDRVLATLAWCNIYPEAYDNHIHRLHSDHASILLRIGHKLTTQRLFRTKN
jgi:hypothetical protein